MELKQLEVFVKVYELRSFSKAAEEIFLSQPSISSYISSLEKELQTQLIYRSTKEVLPTKSGKLLYGYAKEMLSLRDVSVDCLKKFSDGKSGSIDILASSVPAQNILPEILGEFHKNYPDIVFNIMQADTADVIKGVEQRQGEIGFVGAKIENPKCVYEYFMSEKLILIAPREKRFENLGAKGALELLKSQRFVMREAGSGTRLEYEEYLGKIGINASDLKVSAYFNNTQSIICAVANGLGLSIVSELAAKQYIKQKAVIPLYADFLPQRYFYTVLKKNALLSAPLENFINFVRKQKTTDEK